LFYDVSRHFGLAGGAGPAVGIVDMSYRYNERVSFNDGSSARNTGSFGNTDVVYGGYINVTATYHADANGDVYLGLQYMPMSGTSLNDGKGRQGELNLSGQIYISLGVNWIF
jgi:hypothetical protein